MSHLVSDNAEPGRPLISFSIPGSTGRIIESPPTKPGHGLVIMWFYKHSRIWSAYQPPVPMMLTLLMAGIQPTYMYESTKKTLLLLTPCAGAGQPDDDAQLTKHSAFHPCTSKLTSNFAVSRDLWLATQYDATGAVEEYWSCRNNATLQDMSSLLKFGRRWP